jgi:hypothetical protein
MAWEDFLSQESTLLVNLNFAWENLSLGGVFTWMSKQIFTQWRRHSRVDVKHKVTKCLLVMCTLSMAGRCSAAYLFNYEFYGFSPADAAHVSPELAVNYAGILPWNINRWNYCSSRPGTIENATKNSSETDTSFWYGPHISVSLSHRLHPVYTTCETNLPWMSIMITPKGKLNQPNKIQDSLLALINVIKLMTRKTTKKKSFAVWLAKSVVNETTKSAA